MVSVSKRAAAAALLAVPLLVVPTAMLYAARSVVLENGLQVIAEQMRVSPLVAVSVMYRVGSRNEVTGKTGVSHFVEHMLFNGTEKYPEDAAGKEILKSGGIPAGETYWDYTHFGGVMPSDKVDNLLDIEADRMANAIVDSQGVEDERDIILEELAMRGEAPIMVMLEDLFATAFKIHPYHHWWPGGYFTDVDHMEAEYVREFYETYYRPANAVVSVVGNIDEEEAIEKVRQHFEGIQGGHPPAWTPPAEPRQQGLRRATVRGDASEGRIMVFFKGPAYGTRDFEVGTALSTLLGGGRSSVLTREVVDAGMATEAALVQIPTMDPFGFLLITSVEEGGDLKASEKAIYDAIEGFKAGVPDEDRVRMAKTRIEGMTVLSRQTPRARAFELASAAAMGDWTYADNVLANLKSVTPEEVAEVAREYLDWETATIGWLIPRASKLEVDDLIGLAPPVVAPACGLMDESAFASAGFAMTFADAVLEELPNGVRVILKEDHTLPVVGVRAYTLAGSAYEPPGKSGLARLTAKTLAMGSSDFPYEYLYEKIESLGSDVSASTDIERAYLGTSVLSAYADEACHIICDLLTSPSFRSKDFERARRELLSDISQIEEDAADLGLIKFREYFYSGHPYSNPEAGSRVEAGGLGVRDVKTFYSKQWSPRGTVVAVVGDFDTPEMLATLRTHLSGWESKGTPNFDISPTHVEPGFSQYVETLPQKRQIKIYWGMQGPGMKDPDFEAFQVMNFIFGAGAFGSRLFDRIREDEALAYVVNSAVDVTSRPGAMYIHLGTRPKNVGAAIKAVREEVEKMSSEDVTDEEMELTKNFLKSILPFRMQTYSQIAAQLGDLVFFDLPMDYYDTQADRFEKITKQDVLDAAGKYLDLDNSCMVIVGAVDENLKPVKPSYGR
ncbi:MAG: pitrilysin family protein [Candidatus Eisenbacteria bacterium]